MARRRAGRALLPGPALSSSARRPPDRPGSREAPCGPPVLRRRLTRAGSDQHFRVGSPAAAGQSLGKAGRRPERQRPPRSRGGSGGEWGPASRRAAPGPAAGREVGAESRSSPRKWRRGLSAPVCRLVACPAGGEPLPGRGLLAGLVQGGERAGECRCGERRAGRGPPGGCRPRLAAPCRPPPGCGVAAAAAKPPLRLH